MTEALLPIPSSLATVLPCPTVNHIRLIEPETAPPATEWLLQDIVARGAVTLLAGEAKTGKSLLALQWAAAVQGTHRAVIVDAENGRDVIRQRLASLPSPPAVFEARGFNLDEGFDQLEEILADPYDPSTARYDLLVLDSWVSLWTGSETSVTDVKRILEGIRTLAQRYNVGVLLLHHTTKGSDTYRGSGAIAGVVEGIFILARGDSPEERILSCRGLRLGPEPADALLALGADGIFRRLVTPPVKPGRKSVRASRPPTPRELIELRKLHDLTRGEVRRYLGQPTRWWRFGK